MRDAWSTINQIKGFCKFDGVRKKSFEIFSHIVMREGNIGGPSFPHHWWLNRGENMAYLHLFIIRYESF